MLVLSLESARDDKAFPLVQPMTEYRCPGSFRHTPINLNTRSTLEYFLFSWPPQWPKVRYISLQ
jgi:hypothetical protein